MSVELCHFVPVNVLAHCDKAKHDLWIEWNVYALMSMSIPQETQTPWFLPCLLFSPVLNTLFITNISFFMLWSPWLSIDLQWVAIWPLDFRHEWQIQGKQTWSESLYCHLQSSAFPGYPPVIDAPVQNLSHFSGALNAGARLWNYQTSQWPGFIAGFLCVFSRSMFLFLFFQDATST